MLSRLSVKGTLTEIVELFMSTSENRYLFISIGQITVRVSHFHNKRDSV